MNPCGDTKKTKVQRKFGASGTWQDITNDGRNFLDNGPFDGYDRYFYDKTSCPNPSSGSGSGGSGSGSTYTTHSGKSISSDNIPNVHLYDGAWTLGPISPDTAKSVCDLSTTCKGVERQTLSAPIFGNIYYYRLINTVPAEKYTRTNHNLYLKIDASP